MNAKTIPVFLTLALSGGIIFTIPVQGGGKSLQEKTILESKMEACRGKAAPDRDLRPPVVFSSRQKVGGEGEGETGAESEPLREFQRKMELLGEEMRRSAEVLREKMENDLLPRLEREVERLREWLEEWRRKEESKPIEAYDARKGKDFLVFKALTLTL